MMSQRRCRLLACAGERYQVHVQAREPILYYSRRGIEHGSYSKYDILDAVIRSQLREEDVILDGEVIVWNKEKCAAAPPCPAARHPASVSRLAPMVTCMHMLRCA